MIRNIVFDMGQVLLRFIPDLFIERLGVEGEDKKLLKREVFQSLEWARMDRGSLTDAEAAEIICRRVPERLHDAVHKLVAMWDRPILAVEGTEELIAELKEKGYGVYLLSNASYRQHDYWPKLPASRYFDGTLISADVKLVKPQPEIYRLLCETFSLIPDECVFIDDAINNAEGAFLCGMHPIVFHDDVPELRARLRELGVPV
ncbi:MAG: HAD family phosphatase [Oscillospiraceae bacterium]|nr:HAD family phosphatase [Oscillospiraceae bacterium]